MINNSLNLIIIITLFFFIHCAVKVGNLQSESITIDLGEDESVILEINMGAGDLNLFSGTEEPLKADFIYSVKAWKPGIKYNCKIIINKL